MAISCNKSEIMSREDIVTFRQLSNFKRQLIISLYKADFSFQEKPKVWEEMCLLFSAVGGRLKIYITINVIFIHHPYMHRVKI